MPRGVFPHVSDHFVGNAVFLSPLQCFDSGPVRVGIQIREKRIRHGGCVDLRDDRLPAIGQHLSVHTAAADDERILRGVFRRFLRAAAKNSPGDGPVFIPGQHPVLPVGQGPPAGEIRQGPPSHNDAGPSGHFPKKFPVGAEDHRLGAIGPNAPIVIYRNNGFHGPPP